MKRTTQSKKKVAPKKEINYAEVNAAAIDHTYEKMLKPLEVYHKCLQLKQLLISGSMFSIVQIEPHIFARRMPGCIVFTQHIHDQDGVSAQVSVYEKPLREVRMDIESAINEIGSEVSDFERTIEELQNGPNPNMASPVDDDVSEE